MNYGTRLKNCGTLQMSLSICHMSVGLLYCVDKPTCHHINCGIVEKARMSYRFPRTTNAHGAESEEATTVSRTREHMQETARPDGRIPPTPSP